MNKIARNMTLWGKWIIIVASLILCIGIGMVTTPAFAQVITDCTGLADGTPCDDGNLCTVADACTSGLCLGTDAAVCTHNNNFTMVQGQGLTFGGTNDVVFAWDLSRRTSVAVSGQVSNANIVSVGNGFGTSCLFFGAPWSAHDVVIYGPGTYTVYTDCPAGSPGCGKGLSYTFTVKLGQLGAHMLFDYGKPAPTPCGSVNCNIDVVDVYQPYQVFGPGVMNDGVFKDTDPGCGTGDSNRVWDLMSIDWDNDGKNSAPMVDGPFVGFGANFNVMVCGSCDDNNACTTDTCNLSTGLCEHAAKICKTGDTCNPATGHCPACADVLTRCDDGNICTTDGCDEFTGNCTHVANFKNCSNNNACEPLDFCSNKVCVVLAKNCDDGNSCTTDSCDPATGKCSHVTLANGSACDDNDACTTNDVCTDGVCAGTFTPSSTCNASCSPAPTLIYPTDGQGGLGTTSELRWTKCGPDPNGDALKYHITYCITPGTGGCSSNVDVADAGGKNSKSVFYASGAGLLIIGMTFFGGLRGRKKIIVLLIIVTLFAGGAFISCKNTKNANQGTPLGSNEMNYIVSGLTPGTTYYWRVEADDNRGGLVSSPSQSFTTQ